MSILQPINDFAPGKHRSTGPRSINANDAVLRATGVVSLLAIGAIHFLQIVPTTEQTPLLGVSFLSLIAACLAVAARLATHSDQRTWIASAVVCAAAIGGYVFTRTFSTPFDNQDAGNWSCMLGLAALFVETTLLASAPTPRSPRELSRRLSGQPGQALSFPASFRETRARHDRPRQQHNGHRRCRPATWGSHGMNNWHQHRSNPAKPGPARDPVPPGRPASPPEVAHLAGGRRCGVDVFACSPGPP